LNGHIKPRVGSAKRSNLTGPQLASFERDLHKAKVSDAMRRKILVSLSSILRLAVREGSVNRNVAKGHRVKTNKRAKRKLKIGVDIPSIAEIQAFLKVLDEILWRPFFLTAVFTGMRARELRGLKRKNCCAFKSISVTGTHLSEVESMSLRWRLQISRHLFLVICVPLSHASMHRSSDCVVVVVV